MRKLSVEVPVGTFGDVSLIEIVEQETASSSESMPADRARRILELSKVFGMWKGRTDIPTDGLEYQRLMRGE